MNDYRWIQNARQGNLEAFNCLVLAYQDMVFQHAIWMLGEPEAAAYVTQKAFLLAFRNLGAFQEGDYCCWLLKIANRLCLEELSRRQLNQSRLKGDNAGQNNPVKDILESLVGLSPDLRAVLTLVDLQDMDYAQTADILGISVGTVKSRLARARVQMGEMLFG